MKIELNSGTSGDVTVTQDENERITEQDICIAASALLGRTVTRATFVEVGEAGEECWRVS